MSQEVKPIIELELYFVRHGQSHGNAGTAGDDLRSREDPELTEKGENQVRLLGERFSQIKLDAVISSGLVRAMSTAKAVVSHQPQGGAHTFEINPLFTEVGCNANDYHGIDGSELRERFPQAVFGGGDMLIASESNDDAAAYARALKVVEYLKGRFHSGERVLITAHAAFNTLFLFALLGVDYRVIAFDPNLCNTGVTKIVFYAKGTGPFGDDIRLSYCNDLSHLYAEYPLLGFEY